MYTAPGRAPLKLALGSNSGGTGAFASASAFVPPADMRCGARVLTCGSCVGVRASKLCRKSSSGFPVEAKAGSFSA